MAQSDNVHTSPHEAELKNKDGTWKYSNRLEDQTSPYLLQHAHNPVDWYPWGPEAFDKARQEDKLIFLSIGYSTCYWCHVMEREVFENPKIAQKMNEHFVSIKVDREERPDVDDIYMAAAHVMRQQGGWPLSVFLTPPGAMGTDDPGLKPFFVGTYFPAKSVGSLPGFPQIMKLVLGHWQNNRQIVINQADQVSAVIHQALSNRGESGEVDLSIVQNATQKLLHIYDSIHGGFGTHPKFPTPNNMVFLMGVYLNTQEESVWTAIAHTLDRMARGGIYDQVGGGFHRYSTDEKWLVPHFEKMLYDNGQLLEVYAAAYEINPDEDGSQQYARIMHETCAYVLRDMIDESGAFWSAQDAEVNTREGESYVWNRNQIERAIGDAYLSGLAIKMYGVDQGPNFQDPHDPNAEPRNVLFLPRSIQELAAGGPVDLLVAKRKKINELLKIARDRRDQPLTDDKVLTGWNGLMIAGMASVGRVLNESGYVDAAARAADAVVSNMSTAEGGLYRTMRHGQAKIAAFMEDYVCLVHGLIELSKAQSSEPKWLELAIRYTDKAIELFEAPGGGYFDTLADQSDLFVRTRTHSDDSIPSANSQMVNNLIDLYLMTEDPRFLDRSRKDLKSFSVALNQAGPGMAYMQLALLRSLGLTAASAQNQTQRPQLKTSGHNPVHVGIAPPHIERSGEWAALVLTLEIKNTYHINSNTPSDDLLIPTTVELQGATGWTLEADYPDPLTKKYPFADRPLSVYEGRVNINLKIRQSGQLPENVSPEILVRYQACTETACLAPETVELPLILK